MKIKNIETAVVNAEMRNWVFSLQLLEFLQCTKYFIFGQHKDQDYVNNPAAVFVRGTSVFGGKGTIFGTFIGVLIIGSLESRIIAIGL